MPNRFCGAITGDSIRYVTLTDRDEAAQIEILIDGVSQGEYDMYYPFTESPLVPHQCMHPHQHPPKPLFLENRMFPQT